MLIGMALLPVLVGAALALGASRRLSAASKLLSLEQRARRASVIPRKNLMLLVLAVSAVCLGVTYLSLQPRLEGIVVCVLGAGTLGAHTVMTMRGYRANGYPEEYVRSYGAWIAWLGATLLLGLLILLTEFYVYFVFFHE